MALIAEEPLRPLLDPPPADRSQRPTTPRSGLRFAVVDVETTGLDPATSRVIECAVVELDGDGEIIGDFVSLLAIPGNGELGASEIHGISRAMLAGAPHFAELAPRLVERLAGRVVVGHVLAFDLAHLAAEFARCGRELPELTASSICTRDLARAHLPPGPRSLEACCAAAGVETRGMHSALGDALATASLLRWFLRAGHVEALEVAVSPGAERWRGPGWPLLGSGA